MPLTNYITLGRSGLRVSPLCLGAMTFGTEWGIGTGPEESVRVLEAYLAKGGNFIDTANIYNKGHSEKIIGDHLKGDRARRDRLVIATKFCGNQFAGDPNGGGAGRKAIVAQCEESLRRLKTDYIDLYWMHFADKHTPIEETMRALDDLVRDGKVRYLGFTDTPAWRCVQAQYEAKIHHWAPLIALQIEYSLIERTPEGELVPMARDLGLGITPWSPLKGGLLSGKFARGKAGEGRGSGEYMKKNLTDRNWAIIEAVAAVAGEVGATPAQIALSWVNTRPGVTSTILGARTVAQLEDNLRSLDAKLSPEQVRRLDEVSRPQLDFPHDFLAGIGSVIHGGITINGETPKVWELTPRNDSERY